MQLVICAMGTGASTPHLQRFPPRTMRPWRPAVTLAYAQSLDGCIAAARGTPTRLSGAESMRLTHELRARHDAILIGVNTVLADNPQLSTRLVPGPSPRPVVLDSRLRTPPSARLLRDTDGGPRGAIIVCDLEEAESERAESLRAAGALILPVSRVGGLLAARGHSPASWVPSCPTAAPGSKQGRPDVGEASAAGHVGAPLDLRELLASLASRSVRSIMVEGGGHVLRSFLAGGSELYDELCVTVAPVMLAGGPRFGDAGGVGAGDAAAGPPARLELVRVEYETVGADVVVFAAPAEPVAVVTDMARAERGRSGT